VSKHGKARKTAVPPKVAASPGYAISQRLRKRIEECFGWSKTVGGFAQMKLRGLDKVRAGFVFALAVYTIIRLPKLLARKAAPPKAKLVWRREKRVVDDDSPATSPQSQSTTAQQIHAQSAPCGNAVRFSAPLYQRS
jgi:hypothetical protein